MKRASSLAAFGFALVSLCASIAFAEANAAQAGDESNLIPNQYIVVFKDSVSDADIAESELLGHVRGERINSYRDVLRGFAARFSPADLSTIENDPRVAFVSEDRTISIEDSVERAPRISRDARLLPEIQRERAGSAPTAEATGPSSSQTLPTGINRVDAESLANTGAGVQIAVVDTGIQSSHPDLSGQVVGGKNCTNAGGGYTDQNGHGTHVAGTIAGLNNKLGVVGVAPGVKLWAVRVLDRYGRGTWSSVICGLDFVASMAPAKGGPIKVVNMSLGGGGASDDNCGNSNNDALHKAICRVRDAGVTIVVAAGNSGVNAASFVPAAYNDAVITVSALADSDGKSWGLGASTAYGGDDTFASFSNFGNVVDIAGPGVNIYSTWINNGYATLSGTSMATPHVAAGAALYIATHPGVTWTTVKNALVSAGESLGSGHTDPPGLHPEPVVKVQSL